MTLANVVPLVPQMASHPIAQAPTSHYDWLVVGAGFAGSVLAERLAAERESACWWWIAGRTSPATPTITWMRPGC